MNKVNKDLIERLELVALDWQDISNEAWREYVSASGVYRIVRPLYLAVKSKEAGDSHRVIDSDNVSHYIPPGWYALRWTGHDNNVVYEF